MNKKIRNDMAEGMVDTVKNNSRLIILLVLSIVLIVVGVILNSFYGNPISKLVAKKNIELYLNDTYPEKQLLISGIDYNLKSSAYVANVFSTYSLDTYFAVSYTPHQNKIDDDYSFTVGNFLNTEKRLNREYDDIVSPLLADKYSDVSSLYFATLGRYENINKQVFTLDMPLDLDNIPLDSCVVIYINSETLSWQNLALTAVELNDYLTDNGITPDIYDIVLEDSNKNSLGVYDFKSEDLQNENLADFMQAHYQTWAKKHSK